MVNYKTTEEMQVFLSRHLVSSIENLHQLAIATVRPKKNGSQSVVLIPIVSGTDAAGYDFDFTGKVDTTRMKNFMRSVMILNAAKLACCIIMQQSPDISPYGEIQRVLYSFEFYSPSGRQFVTKFSYDNGKTDIGLAVLGWQSRQYLNEQRAFDEEWLLT